jgi:hypothetical protein
MFALFPAKFLEFQTFRAARFFVGPVIPGIAHRAFKPNVFTHDEYPISYSIGSANRGYRAE